MGAYQARTRRKPSADQRDSIAWKLDRILIFTERATCLTWPAAVCKGYGLKAVRKLMQMCWPRTAAQINISMSDTFGVKYFRWCLDLFPCMLAPSNSASTHISDHMQKKPFIPWPLFHSNSPRSFGLRLICAWSALDLLSRRAGLLQAHTQTRTVPTRTCIQQVSCLK